MNKIFSNKAQKYNILAFLIAIMIFTFGFLVSDYINDKRFLKIERIRQKLEIQIMGMETQLTHFKDILCPDINDDILDHELHTVIEEKIQFMANNLGKEHPEVIHFKKYYSLLQIQHYQFSKELNQKCDLGLTHIIHLYADLKMCPDCDNQGHVLNQLQKNYKHLRIYSFDYNLKLPALAVIKPVIPSEYLTEETKNNREKKYLPIIIINNKPFFGFQDLEEMKKNLKLN
jgi:glutaredoxin